MKSTEEKLESQEAQASEYLASSGQEANRWPSSKPSENMSISGSFDVELARADGLGPRVKATMSADGRRVDIHGEALPRFLNPGLVEEKDPSARTLRKIYATEVERIRANEGEENDAAKLKHRLDQAIKEIRTKEGIYEVRERDLREEIRRLKKERQLMAEELGERDEKVASLDRHVADCEEKMAEVMEERLALLEKVAELETKRDQLQARLAARDEERADWYEERETMRAILDATDKERADREEELAAMRAKLAANDAERAAMLAEQAAKDEALAAKDEALAAMRAERAAMLAEQAAKDEAMAAMLAEQAAIIQRLGQAPGQQQTPQAIDQPVGAGAGPTEPPVGHQAAHGDGPVEGVDDQRGPQGQPPA